MRILLVIVALLAAAPALAKEITVSDQEQQALQTICDVASVSTTINREVRAQIANFCVSWEKRVAEANKPVAPADANGTPAKPEKK